MIKRMMENNATVKLADEDWAVESEYFCFNPDNPDDESPDNLKELTLISCQNMDTLWKLSAHVYLDDLGVSSENPLITVDYCNNPESSAGMRISREGLLNFAYMIIARLED